MKIMIITDAWEPQVNGVVRTLKQTRQELELMGHEIDMLTPLEFKTIPCPTYPDISLSILPSTKVAKRIKKFNPDALHIATEGPLGISARSYAIKHNLPFSTAYIKTVFLNISFALTSASRSRSFCTIFILPFPVANIKTVS